MTISFKLSVFKLEINHKILQELGEFTIFCMKAISSNLEIKYISNIIQIDEDVIKKQLSFAISREYLTDNFYLTKKGEETIKLFEFITLFNKNNIKIAMEHYIEKNSKKIYSASNSKLDNIAKGYIPKDNFYDYKVVNKFDEILNNDKNSIKDIILEEFKDYKEIIEKYIDDFIFKPIKLNEQKFYNYEIEDIKFVNNLSNNKKKEKEYISIKIPIIEIKKKIKSSIVSKEHIELVQNMFDNYRYIDLIIGNPISHNNIQEANPNIEIKPTLREIDLLKNNLSNQEIWLNIFLFTDITTKIKKYGIIKYLNISDIMDKI